MHETSDIASLQARVRRLQAENNNLRQELASLHGSFSLFLEQAPIGISIVQQLSLTYANAKWLQLFGYQDQEQVIGRSSLEYLAPEIRDETLEQLQHFRHHETGELQLETRGLRRDGETFDLLLTVTRMQVMGAYGYVSFIQDISDLKKMQRELARSMAQYKAIFNNASAGIAIVDAANRYLEVNRHYAQMFGYAVEQFAHLDPLQLIHPDSRRNTQGLLQQLFEGRIPYYMNEKRFLRSDGSCFWGSVFVSALKETRAPEAPDVAASAICLVIDITERKRAQHELEKLNRELEDQVRERTSDLEAKAKALEDANAALQRLDDMKTSFVSSVSHELRTPLTSILGFAKLIRKDFNSVSPADDKVDSKQNKLRNRIINNLSIIENEGERLSRLVNDVLDLNKIEAGYFCYDIKPVPIASCIYEALLAIGGHFSQKQDIKLHSNIAPDLPLVQADPDRLAQVLINLLHNAAKFTERGTVTISAEVRQEGTVRVTVTDTGCGISSEDLPKIFDKFHQAATGDTLERPYHGTGLGLSICKQIIELFEGRIWATSEPGRGSSFHFELPSHDTMPASQTSIETPE